MLDFCLISRRHGRPLQTATCLHSLLYLKIVTDEVPGSLNPGQRPPNNTLVTVRDDTGRLDNVASLWKQNSSAIRIHQEPLDGSSSGKHKHQGRGYRTGSRVTRTGIQRFGRRVSAVVAENGEKEIQLPFMVTRKNTETVNDCPRKASTPFNTQKRAGSCSGFRTIFLPFPWLIGLGLRSPSPTKLASTPLCG